MNTAVDNTVNFAAPPRGPVDAICTCLIKFCDFRGRASRSEFWWFFALAVVLESIKVSLPKQFEAAGFFLVFLFAQPPLWAVMARRLHDINISGWWVFPYPAVVTLDAVAGLFSLYSKGTVFPNEESPIGWIMDFIMPYYLLAPRAIAIIIASVAIVVLFVVLLCLCLIKGKPGQNRFDRGANPANPLSTNNRHSR